MNTPRGLSGLHTPVSMEPRDGKSDLDLIQVIQALWRGRLAIIAFGVLFALVGGVYGFRVAQPEYAATTTLVLQERNQPVVDLNAVMSNLSTELSSLNTELHVIRSRGLVEQLVDTLGLVNDPEFNPEISASSAVSTSSAKTWLRNTLSLGADAPDSGASSAVRDQVVRNVQEAITAQIQRNTYLFAITVTSQDRAKAAEMANTLARLYIDEQVHTKFAAVEDAVLWLSERVSALEVELRERENAVSALRARTDLASVVALEAKSVQLKDSRNRLLSLVQRTQAAQTQLEALSTHQKTGDFAAIADLFGDSALTALLVEGAAEANEARLTAQVALIETRARATLERLELQKSALGRSVAELEDAVGRQAADLAELQQLEREAQATKVLYETFLTRLKEASVQRGLQQADSRILSQAVLGTHVAPKKTLILVLSLLAGLTVGGGMVLSRQFLHAGYRTADELEAATGTPVLGQIPLIPISARGDLLSFLSSQPTAAATEAIRNLRTSLLMSNVDAPPQVILSASSVPGEGKTTQSIALVHNLAGLNNRVLLIEGDIRRRTLMHYIHADRSRGIISALSGNCTLAEAVIHDPSLHADVLLGEVSRLNAADVFASQRFAELMAQARASYDVIVIDSPPVLVVPDARVIARHADAVVYTVAWDKTKRSQVAEGLRQFETVNIPITGLVLSRIDPRGMARYGYAGRHGAYSTFGDSYYGAR